MTPAVGGVLPLQPLAGQVGWVTPAVGGAPLAAPGRAGWVLAIAAATAR